MIHGERLSAVGQLVAGIAHELNNPLQSVIGMSQLLMGPDCDDQLRQDLESIRANGERAAMIVRNLLAFARQSALERSMADLSEIVRSALALRVYELRNAPSRCRRTTRPSFHSSRSIEKRFSRSC